MKVNIKINRGIILISILMFADVVLFQNCSNWKGNVVVSDKVDMMSDDGGFTEINIHTDVPAQSEFPSTTIVESSPELAPVKEVLPSTSSTSVVVIPSPSPTADASASSQAQVTEGSPQSAPAVESMPQQENQVAVTDTIPAVAPIIEEVQVPVSNAGEVVADSDSAIVTSDDTLASSDTTADEESVSPTSESSITGEFITCSSVNYKKAVCKGKKDIASAVVSERFSKMFCKYGVTWGISGKEIWVKYGCRASFWVSY